MVDMKYKIITQRYGGEHTIGTISAEVARYWLHDKREAINPHGDFEEYIFDADDRNEEGSIPEKYQLPNWYEIDDIYHGNPLEYSGSNRLDVIDTETDKYVAENIDITSISINKTKDALQEYKDDNPKYGGAYVFGQSFEKAGWEYELETDKPFDIAKLKVNISVWSDLHLVETLVYDGDELDWDMPDGSWGKSQTCWIEW